MTLLADDNPHQRAMGRALVDALLDSDLAQEDDRRIAQRMLAAAALAGWPDDVSPTRQTGGRMVNAVDDVAVVEDDETIGSPVQEER
jgi:hypothetical protein